MKKIIIAIILTFSLNNIYSDNIFSSKKLYNISSLAIGYLSAALYDIHLYAELHNEHYFSNYRTAESLGVGALTALAFKLITEKYIRPRTIQEKLNPIYKALNAIDKNLLSLIYSKDIVKAVNLYECKVNAKYPLVFIVCQLESLNEKLKDFENALIKIKLNTNLKSKEKIILEIENRLDLMQSKISNILFYIKNLPDFATQFDFCNQELKLNKEINYLKRKKARLVFLKYQAYQPPLIIYY